MHQAYKVHSVLKNFVHIACIAAYGNNVILATHSGQLIMYSVNEEDVVDMRIYNKNFSKKATQMEVVPEESLLFVLADNTMLVYEISNLEKEFRLLYTAPVNKGCTLFTLDVNTAKSTTGEVATVIRVCCAMKRELKFFYWKVKTLHSLEFMIELKDVPRTLCWVGNVICVGFKDEYVIYNILSNKPEKHDLIVTSSSKSIDPCIAIIKNNLLGVSKDNYLVPIDPKEYIKSNDTKSQAHGSIDVAVAGVESKNTLKPIGWSSPLQALVWDDPFAIGRVSQAVEVRYIDSNGPNKDTLVQTIKELSQIKHLVRSAKGCIFAAGNSELWCIRMVDIPTQRNQLIQKKKFQLAIELTNISDEVEEIKAETIRQIHMRYARELFANKEFRSAMKEFQFAAADPYDVIRLFPNLLQEPKSTENVDPTVPVVKLPQLEDKDLENAILALIEFLTLARQKEIVKLRDTKNSSKSLLSIIDTTLLKCYLQTNDSLVAPLLRLNQCHLEESEKTLKKHDKISELIILYQTNGKHKKALDLLQAQATIEGSSLYGTERTIRYLQQLGLAHIGLLFEYADWVLKKDPQDGLRIFTEDFIEVESLPRANVLNFLLTGHKSLVIPYLEHIITVWRDSNTFLHNVLVKQYREKVQTLLEENEKSAFEEGSEKSQELKSLREKLYNFLKHSNKYSPDVLIKEFPTTMMFEERALILGRLQKHEKVLAIYIQILGDVEKASEYCEANYENDRDIFITLLKIIISPLKQPPYEGVKLHPNFLTTNQEMVLELLSKYATKIDPIKIWPYLPDDMPLHRLRDFLETVLRLQMAERHHTQVMKGLLAAETLRLRSLIEKQQNKYVEMNEFSVCPECKKRFSNQTAFVRYPNGEVVHLSCHDKRLQSLNNST